MIGLRSNFGLSLTLVLAIVAVTAAGGLLTLRWSSVATNRWMALARVLSMGAVAVTLAATALPRRWAIETDGDLVLRPGRGGLGDWPVLLSNPTSLASVELVGNVALYVAIGFTATLGWYRRRHVVLLLGLALSLAIESIQFAWLGRVAALDDVILNGAGLVAGWLIAIALARLPIGRAFDGAGRPPLPSPHTPSHTDVHARGHRRLPAGLSGRV